MEFNKDGTVTVVRVEMDYVKYIKEQKELLDKVYIQYIEGAITSLELQTHVMNLSTAVHDMQLFEVFGNG